MENINLKQRINTLTLNGYDFVNLLMCRSVRNTPVKLTLNSMVEKFDGKGIDFFVLTYKNIPIAFCETDGYFYDITDVTPTLIHMKSFRTKKTDRIIRKFQKKYAPNFSVYYVYRP